MKFKINNHIKTGKSSAGGVIFVEADVLPFCVFIVKLLPDNKHALIHE